MTLPRTVAVALQTPLTVAGETVTSLTVRRPVAGELRGVELTPLIRMDTDAALDFLPRICQPNVTTGDLEQLDVYDFGQVAGVLAGFFYPSPPSLAAVPSSTPSSAS